MRLHSRSGLSAHETDWQFLMATTRPNPSRTAISIPCNVVRTTRCRLRNSPQRGDHRSVAPQESHTTSTAFSESRDKPSPDQRAMITIHHLGVSQSDRIVWLMEELGLPYDLKWYRR